jgi:hypothetical protein
LVFRRLPLHAFVKPLVAGPPQALRVSRAWLECGLGEGGLWVFEETPSGRRVDRCPEGRVAPASTAAGCKFLKIRSKRVKGSASSQGRPGGRRYGSLIFGHKILKGSPGYVDIEQS